MQRSGLRVAAGAACLAILLVLEWRWFAAYVHDFVLTAYPQNHDQVVYLWRSYWAHSQIGSRGVLTALADHVGRGDPVGALLDFEAAVAYDLVAPNRFGALAVGFVHFAALQIGILALLAWYTGSVSFGMLGVALLLASGFAHHGAGGLLDFRLDFTAACVYGLLVAALARARCFRDAGWAAVSGLVGGYLIGMRHNTFVYVAVLFAVLGATAMLLDARRDRATRSGRLGPHTRGALVAALALALAAAPFVLTSYEKVAEYYAAQFASRGPARNLLEGRDWLEHWAFYPVSLYRYYLGQSGAVFVLALAALAACYAASRRSDRHRGAPAPARESGRCYWIVGASLAIPLAIFTMHTARSDAVARMLVPSIVFLAAMALADVAAAARRLRPPSGAVAAVWGVTAALLLAFGAAAHLRQYTTSVAGASIPFAERRAVFAMHGDIAELLYRLGVTRPTFVVNSLQEWLEPRITAVAAFENQKAVVLPTTPAIENQIFADDETFWGTVRTADVVLLQTAGYKERYPYVEFADSVADELRGAAVERFVPIGDWSFTHFAVSAWIAPRIKLVRGVNLESAAGPATAFTVSVPRRMLAARPRLTLRGAGTVPLSLRASARLADGAPVSSRVEVGEGGYRMVLDVDPPRLGDADPVALHVELDAPGLSLPSRGEFAPVTAGVADGAAATGSGGSS